MSRVMVESNRSQVSQLGGCDPGGVTLWQEGLGWGWLVALGGMTLGGVALREGVTPGGS